MLQKISCFKIGCNDWDSLIDLLALSSSHPAEFFARPSEKQLSFGVSAAK
jgi:hypothetical protein